MISQLLEIDWWDWSDEKVKRNHQLFETNLESDEDINLSLILVD